MKKISITILLTIMIFFCAMPVYASNDITTNEKIISLWKSSDLPSISPYSKYVHFLSQDIYQNYDKTQARYLQKELNAVLGCNLDTNGIVDSQTRKYIKDFQKAYNLPITGSVDSKTRNFLNVAYKFQKVIVSANSLNVRNKPGTSNSDVIGVATKGTIFSIISTHWVNGTKWYGIAYNDGVTGYISSKYTKNTFVEVDIVSQTLRLYKNSLLILDSAITTGKKGSYDTQKGYFEVMFIDTDRYLQPSNAFVHYWMRFNNPKAQGLHDASWRGSTENFTYFGGTVYKQNGKAGTKYSGSKGCVNIPPNKMPIIFNNIGLGTPVYVH